MPFPVNKFEHNTSQKSRSMYLTTTVMPQGHNTIQNICVCGHYKHIRKQKLYMPYEQDNIYT